jgi:NADH:ubiquinone reductase (H+-translocating)
MKLRRHVVVVGGGFGGLGAARALAHAPVRVTLLDRQNHHLFQPLLYQVAMAGLAPGEVAVPIRSVLRLQQNVRVLLSDVTDIDLEQRLVLSREAPPTEYDYLILAPGAENTYFGHDEWQHAAPGLKDIDDALEVRRRVLLAFEAAERETDPVVQRRLLTFVVIGGGPTGVELAGAIAELATFVLARDFRAIHSDATRVILIEGSPRVLGSFPPALSASAQKNLAQMGVEVRAGLRVTHIDQTGVSCGDERIEASTVLWAAGVRASGLCERIGIEVDRQGRAKVAPDCSVAGHPEVFVVGDAATFIPDAAQTPLPQVSPVAMQQARFVARQIERSLEDLPRERFVYVDKGSMATIGRSRAVAVVGKLQLTGLIAWLAWLALHIFYLIGFRNRLVVLVDWAWAYFGYRRGSRLITGRRLQPGVPPVPERQHPARIDGAAIDAAPVLAAVVSGSGSAFTATPAVVRPSAETEPS